MLVNVSWWQLIVLLHITQDMLVALLLQQRKFGLTIACNWSKIFSAFSAMTAYFVPIYEASCDAV